MKYKNLSLCIVLLGLTLFSSCKTNNYIEISRTEMENKVKGAWAGKMIGVMYGRPMEFKATGVTFNDSIPWKPEFVEKALLEDDIYGQLNFMITMERLGLNAPLDSIAKNFAYAKFPLCHSNLQSRKNYFDGIAAEKLSLPENNIHAEDIDFQIESDFIGFINPGMPQSSNELCKKIGSIMAAGDGLYGGMYVTAMHSLAYTTNNVDSIINTALLAIPKESKYAQCIKDVIDAYQENPNDWKYAWNKIQTKWGEKDICAPYHAFNIDAKLNGAYIVIGLIYGKGDIEKTMEITIRCGQDTDCNSANGAAVLCIMHGYNGIPNNLKSFIPNVADKSFLHTDYSYNKAVNQTMKFIDENVINNGGKIENNKYYIKKQNVATALMEEGFQNLDMSYQVQVRDESKWKFIGSWQDFVYGDGDNDLYKLATTPGDAFEIKFKGSGVALLGSWNSDCGKAQVYIDDVLIKEVDTYYREEAGKYDVNRAYLFHKLGLKEGDHTLKVVVSPQKNPSSKGHKLYIERIIAYK